MKSLNWMKVLVSALSIGVAAISLTMPTIAQELPKVYDASVPRERQIALALSAAPPEVSSNATVYILGLKGYEKVREGTNGFSCFVGRSFVKPTETTVEPTCFDAEGSRTILIRRMRMEELRANGKSEAEIKADIANGYKEGRFKDPSKPGFLYMMSSENRLPSSNGATASFPPHLMFYAPNMTTKDIGFESQPQLDYLGMTHPGAGDNLIVVVPTASTPPASGLGR
ncbi:MAG: hypothetical protein ABSD87_09010 [Candidatus Acidiferrales bacterium]